MLDKKYIFGIFVLAIICSLFLTTNSGIMCADFDRFSIEKDGNTVYNYIYNSIDPAVTSELNVYPNEDVEITYRVRSRVTRDYKRNIITEIDGEQVHLTEVTLRPENTIIYDYYSETFVITAPSEIGEHTITHTDNIWWTLYDSDLEKDVWQWIEKDKKTYTFNVIEDPNAVASEDPVVEDSETTPTEDPVVEEEEPEETSETTSEETPETTPEIQTESEVPSITESIDDEISDLFSTDTIVENSRETDDDKTIIIMGIVIGILVILVLYFMFIKKE